MNQSPYITADDSRIADIFQQHAGRLARYKQRCEEADLFVPVLLATLEQIHRLSSGSFGLGSNPARKYYMPHPNRALRQLCEDAAQAVTSKPLANGHKRTYSKVPPEFLLTHCVDCRACGDQFLAKRSDARYCSGACQKRSLRESMSVVIRQVG